MTEAGRCRAEVKAARFFAGAHTACPAAAAQGATLPFGPILTGFPVTCCANEGRQKRGDHPITPLDLALLLNASAKLAFALAALITACRRWG